MADESVNCVESRHFDVLAEGTELTADELTGLTVTPIEPVPAAPKGLF